VSRLDPGVDWSRSPQAVGGAYETSRPVDSIAGLLGSRVGWFRLELVCCLGFPFVDLSIKVLFVSRLDETHSRVWVEEHYTH
jgi:hypothetical protein